MVETKIPEEIKFEIKFKDMVSYLGGYPPIPPTALLRMKVIGRKVILEKLKTKFNWSNKGIEIGVLDIQRIVKMDFKATSQNPAAIFMFGFLGGWSPKRKFILYKDPTNEKEYELEFDRFDDRKWDKFKDAVLKIQYETGKS